MKPTISWFIAILAITMAFQTSAQASEISFVVGDQIVKLSDHQLKCVRLQFDKITNAPVVEIKYDENAARQVAALTANNISEMMQIKSSQQVISEAVIVSELAGTSFTISGMTDMTKVVGIVSHIGAKEVGC